MPNDARKKIRAGGAVPAARMDKGKRGPGPWVHYKGTLVLQVLLIVAAGLWIYAPVFHGEQLWDDGWYSTNPLLHDFSGLWGIWFQPGQWIEYYPIEETVEWVQWQFWGDNVLGYHLTNVVLHVVSGLLVWRLLGKFGLRLAWLGGLLFVVHPVQVESVAWMVELKNTLSLPPLLLAMCAWIDYEEHRRTRDYGLALGLFLAAMLCKISMMLFPAVILLYAWWKRGRIGWGDVKASAPFFAISLVLAETTTWVGNWYVQVQHQPYDIVHLGGLWSRLALAGLTFSFYFSKCVLPVGLLPIYPSWPIEHPSLVQFLPWPVMAAVFVWLWRRRTGWGRHALLGLGFFVINLAPIAGFKEISFMKFSWVMDHFLYIPIIGLIGLAVAAVGGMGQQLPGWMRRCGVGALVIVFTTLVWGSREYEGIFVNQETLWGYTLQYNPDAWIAHNNLGNIYAQSNRIPEAAEQYEAALRGKPAYAEAHCNLGVVLEMMGRSNEAIAHYEEALRLNPNYVEAHDNLGLTLLRIGQVAGALDHFEQAVRLEPESAQAHYCLAKGFAKNGQAAQAAQEYAQVLKIDPTDADSHNNLGNALLQTGQVSDAIDHYGQALRLRPDFAEAHFNLGKALLQTGRLPEAIDQFEQALQLNPNLALAQLNLGNALFRAGRAGEALDHYMQAVQIDPANAESHNNLGVVLIQMGRPSDAMKQFEVALQLQPKYPEAQNNLARLKKLQKTPPAKP